MISTTAPERRAMVKKRHSQLSIKAQRNLLSIHRSGLYYQPCGESSLNLHLMRRIDEHFLTHPYEGTRRMEEWLTEAIFPKKDQIFVYTCKSIFNETNIFISHG